jgi:hypothetical protein
MTSLNSYTFHNTDRIGADFTDATQQNVANTHFANHMLTNYFSDKMTNAHVQFATAQPIMSFNALANGNGIHSGAVDQESKLLINVDQSRPLEKLQLFQRPFVTVPYLGKGSRDPTLESRLMQGELVSDRKSVSTIMEKSFAQYSLYPSNEQMEAESKDASKRIEEAALDGWVRGGMTTREMSTTEISRQQNRPNGIV